MLTRNERRRPSHYITVLEYSYSLSVSLFSRPPTLSVSCLSPLSFFSLTTTRPRSPHLSYSWTTSWGIMHSAHHRFCDDVCIPSCTYLCSARPIRECVVNSKRVLNERESRTIPLGHDRHVSCRSYKLLYNGAVGIVNEITYSSYYSARERSLKKFTLILPI